MSNYNLTMLTDFYELTMMQGYFESRKQDRIVVFDVFFRDNPWKSGFSVMAGLEQVLDYVENLHFDDDDIDYLRSLHVFSEDFLEYLRNFKFTGTIYAIEEGRLIFPREPIVKIVAPIMEAQLVETAILNILNHQCLIATKAARVTHSTRDDTVFEFGLRRAQGPDAGIYGARASVIGGCHATSNVLAGKMFNIPVRGTHAHSWIMNFDSELEAFREYARLYKDQCILLVDTYDTIHSGVPNAIKVFQEMREQGIKSELYGIRLDSGDLAYLSKKARAMLDEAGFPDAIVSASNDLDELLIESLKIQGATITSWGVGTNLITANGNSSFGGVYKMAAVKKPGNGFIPKIKLSDNIDKVTYPGNKKIYRIYEEPDHKIKADYICLDYETVDTEKDLHIFDPLEPWKKTLIKAGTYSVEEMLVPVFVEGKRVYHSPEVMEIREICKKDQSRLWDESRRLLNPHQMYVDLSDDLYALQQKLLNDRKNLI